jgi:hypothetical protein
MGSYNRAVTKQVKSHDRFCVLRDSGLGKHGFDPFGVLYRHRIVDHHYRCVRPSTGKAEYSNLIGPGVGRDGRRSFESVRFVPEIAFQNDRTV